MRRVTRPADASSSANSVSQRNELLRTVYLEYLMKYLPVVAEKVASNPEAYVYLAESIREWPDRELSHIIQRSGWVDVQWRNLTGHRCPHRAVRL